MNLSVAQKFFPWLAAIVVPLAYFVFYTPYGMDTTDFGYFYGYAWRILEGQVPYRDFSYIKPPLALYWHALWMWLTPGQFQILAGKLGFACTLLAASWLMGAYFDKVFNLRSLGLPLPLLATCGFVFSVHSFPHMPWHTADGILFCSATLYAAVSGMPILAGVAAACAMLCKQSFLLIPLMTLLLILLCRSSKKEVLLCAFGWLCFMGAACFFIYFNGAWTQFRSMTTGQLNLSEALDAGILIYLRQNILLPVLALAPWFLMRLLRRKPISWLAPAWVYLVLLCITYVYVVYSKKGWIGFGMSWPTLFMVLGGICVFFPKKFLLPYLQNNKMGHPALGASVSLAAALAISWSVAVSGGYKTPAMAAVPLVFSFFIINASMAGRVLQLAWATLLCGLVMFGAGYQYPYMFPERPLKRSDLIYDAGDIYSKAAGVYVDRQMRDKLEELKDLRHRYGANYKTLPGFSHAYYLNGDFPVYGSDWLIDWEINGDIDRLYNELLQKKIIVFMEKDQMDATKADSYDRAGYGVPQKVRKNWRKVDETPHFIVLMPPD